MVFLFIIYLSFVALFVLPFKVSMEGFFDKAKKQLVFALRVGAFEKTFNNKKDEKDQKKHKKNIATGHRCHHAIGHALQHCWHMLPGNHVSMQEIADLRCILPHRPDKTHCTRESAKMVKRYRKLRHLLIDRKLNKAESTLPRQKM